MIDIVVKDYLAVKEAKIRVTGLTVLRGESYSGKSSFFRALQAAVTNRFSSGCVRWGSPEASISVRCADSGAVLRVTRGSKGSTVYSLGGVNFEKVGRNVPTEVASFLNLGVLVSGADQLSLTFWEQFSRPLLHSFSQARIGDLLGGGEALRDWTVASKSLSVRKSELKGIESVLLQQVDDAVSAVAAWGSLVADAEPLMQVVQERLSAVVMYRERLSLLRELSTVRAEAAEVLSCFHYYWKLHRSYADLCDSSSKVELLHSLRGAVSVHRSFVEGVRATSAVLSGVASVLSSQLRFVHLSSLGEFARQCFVGGQLRCELLSCVQQVETVGRLHSLRVAMGNIGSLGSSLQQLRLLASNDRCPLCGGLL